ncbi:MAG: leucine-rich repeat domain-containing protein [Clostridia bacterium]|nr:leucine-rich repeat domain-containing protein [Clostridia bacterium]
MKKTGIRTICLLLTLLLALPTLAGLTAFAGNGAAIVASGYCGLDPSWMNEGPDFTGSYEMAHNLSWTLDSEGVLTVRGTGKMMNFYDGDQEYFCSVPWNKNDIRRIVIEEGVESIGMGAFCNCSQLRSVELPTSLKKIYQHAFNGSRNLRSIALPDSVDIGNISVCLGGVEHISIFRGAYNKAGNWANGSLGEYEGGVGHVVSVTIEEGTRYIPQSAFALQKNLNKLILSQTVSDIGAGAFYGCTGLNSVYYTGTEEQWDNFRKDICGAYTDYRNIDDYLAYHEYDNNSALLYDEYDSVLYVLYFTDINYVYFQDGHYLIDTDATEATATEHGYTAGVYCVDTDTWVSGHEVVHNTLGERTVVKEPTEDEPGECVIVCTVCGESGLYAMEPYSPHGPQPDDPDDPDNPDNPDDPGGSGQQSHLPRFLKSIVDWFLRLIRWLGNLIKH